jgi:hypothetical protein
MRRRAVFLASALAIVACTEPPTDLDRSRNPNCEQTYEFGNFGCTRMLLVVTPPDGIIPMQVMLTVMVEPLREHTGLNSYIDGNTSLDSLSVNLIRWDSGQPSTDTVSVRVIARLLDRSGATASGPLPLLGVDTVHRVLQIAPVGALAPVDTVRIVLERPSSASNMRGQAGFR